MRSHSITMLGTGLIGDFYTMHAARPAWPRPRARRLLAQRGARARPSASAGASPSTRPTWRRPSSTPTPTWSSSRCRTTSTRRPSARSRRPARPSSAPSRSGGPRPRRSGCSRRSSGRASSPATSRTSATRPRRSRRSRSTQAGAIGEVTWVRSRETHPGPHSAWFWDGRLTGGGAIIDLGCHCIEIIRSFVGKGNRPVEVLCHTDTLVHPDRRRGQRRRAHPLRVRRHRPVRGQLDVPRRHGPARRGRRARTARSG